MFLATKLNTGGSLGGYQISRSLRFNSADSAYLNRTPASAGNRKTWTWSAWIKRSALGVTQQIFSSRPTASPYALIYFASETLNYAETGLTLTTTQVFRDVSAWYHIVIATDTTQATASDRLKFYVNGVQVTSFSTATYPSQNYDTQINTATQHNLSGAQPYGAEYFTGYMTEVNFIDGQALTPSSFGETNAQTGVWQPKAYSGSYGTNGFYLNFSDNSNTTAATLGKDYSGNGNNWTPNNFSVSAGAGNDSLVDVPTNWGVDTGVGGTVRGNYCTWNPLTSSPGITVPSNGNLDITDNFNPAPVTLGTIAMSSGKWYWEVQINTVYSYVGVATPESRGSVSYLGAVNGQFMYNPNTITSCFVNGSVYNYSTGSSATSGDIIGIALNFDTDVVTYYKNGVSMGAFSSGLLTGKTYLPAFKSNDAASASFNFGQRPFAYTAPSGYKALCTQNLPTPTIGATSTTTANQYFNVVTYAGTGTTNPITVGFAPDFAWTKSRSGSTWHDLSTTLQGNAAVLFSNSTAAEASYANNCVFGSNGVTLGSSNDGNINGTTNVAWFWKGGGTGVTNTAGSITSTVSANTTSGFSVVTYTGTGSVATVGHGLGVAPYMVIVKRRDGVADWATWHTSIGTQVLFLNLTNAATSGTAQWNGTTPTSSVFTVSTSSGVNGSGGTYVAYCFAPIAGYSAFGQYTGNGSSDGVFVYTGFRPAYLLIKRTTSAYNWWILDAARGTINAVKGRLYADASDAESTTYPYVDFLSNGFKLRDADGGNNANGEPYIYACFAQNPFKYSLAR